MTKFVAITRHLSSRVWRFEDRDFNIDKFGIGTDCVLPSEPFGGNAPGVGINDRNQKQSTRKLVR